MFVPDVPLSLYLCLYHASPREAFLKLKLVGGNEYVLHHAVNIQNQNPFRKGRGWPWAL